MFEKAKKSMSKLRVGIAGVAGSGKTYSALLIAKGIGGKIACIDTEHGSASLYCDLVDFDVMNMEAPYKVERYIEAIEASENANYDTLVIDSLSHAWAGTGGLLELKEKIASYSNKNSYTAWADVTPLHNKLIETMLKSKCHIIGTMRSKQDYAMTQDNNNRTSIKKIGLAPVQRDGLDYEFTVFFDISNDHIVNATKDRTGLFSIDDYFTPGIDTGEKLVEWLGGGQ